MNFDEMADSFRNMTVDEIIAEIDRKIASCSPEDVKGKANLTALKKGFLLSTESKRKL